MRRWQSILALGLMFVAMVGVVTAQTSAQKQIAGRWEGRRPAEGREDLIALVFDVGAKGLEGTVFYNGQEFGKMEEIKVTGDVVTFVQGNMSFTGVVDAKNRQSMKLTAHFDNRDLWDMTLKRGTGLFSTK